MRRLRFVVVWILVAGFLGTPLYLAVHHNLAYYAALSRYGLSGSARVTVTDPQDHNNVCYAYAFGRRRYSACDSSDDDRTSQLRPGQYIPFVYDAQDPSISCLCRDPHARWTSELDVATFIATVILGFATLAAAGASRRARASGPGPEPVHDVGTDWSRPDPKEPAARSRPPSGVMSRDDARRLLSARRSLRVSALVIWVGSINILSALALDVRTYLGGLGPGYEAAFLPSFVLAFPLWGWAVLLLMSLAGGTRRGLRSDRPRWADAVGSLPRWVLWTLAGADLLGFVGAATGLAAITGGQPGFNASTGQYTLNNHGSISVVSQAVYEQALAGGIRGFLAGAIFFSSLPVAVALNHWLTRRTPRDTQPVR